MNLISLINSALEHVVYCSNLVSNYILIRLIRFVSRFTIHLCDAIYFSTAFSILCKRFTKILRFRCKDLNTALVSSTVVSTTTWQRYSEQPLLLVFDHDRVRCPMSGVR